MVSIAVAGLTVVKDGRPVLDDVDLTVGDGELMAVIGMSGSGKTTLLRAIAGLDRVTSGDVLFDGDVVTSLDPRDRKVAMVFQDAVLYPFLTARANVAFPLEIQHRPADEVEARVSAESRALGIERVMEARPNQISSGHRQLVQVARAMVRAPHVVLFDEPLAMVDPQARAAMRAELRTVQRGYGVTALYVTNDPVEAMAMGDRLAVMVGGRLTQVDAPLAVYGTPASVEVAEVTGDISLIPATVVRDPPGFRVDAGGLRLRAWSAALGTRVDRRLTLGIRPEDAVVDTEPGSGGEGPFPATVVAVEPVGHHDVLTLDVGGVVLRSRSAPGVAGPGDRVRVTIRNPHLFDAESGRRI